MTSPDLDRHGVLIRQLQGAAISGNVNADATTVTLTPGAAGALSNSGVIAHGLGAAPTGAVGMVVLGGTYAGSVPIECVAGWDAATIQFQHRNNSGVALVGAGSIRIAWITWA